MPPASFDITQWHHYLGSYDGAQVRLYVDGVLRAQFAAAGTAGADGGPLSIGRDDDWPRFGAAFIDEVAIYGQALSDARIAAHARAQAAAASCSPITGATGSSYKLTSADSASACASRSPRPTPPAGLRHLRRERAVTGGTPGTAPLPTALPVLTGQPREVDRSYTTSTAAGRGRSAQLRLRLAALRSSGQ